MRILLALVLAHVPGAGAGTAVGNPTGLTLDTAPGAGLAVTSASAEVEAVLVTDRKGATWALEVDGPFDLRGGTRVEVPLSDASRVQVLFAGPLELSGVGPGGATFRLALEVPSVDVTLAAAPGEVDDAVLRLGEPGWLSADELGLGSGEEIEVDEGDGLHDALVAALSGGAALYRDLDADGRCDGGDLDDDDLEPDDEPDDDEGECAGTPLGAVR